MVRSVTLLSQCTWTKQAELLELKKASKGGDSDSNDGDEGKRAMGVYTTKLCSSSISLCAIYAVFGSRTLPGRRNAVGTKYRRRNTSGCDYCPGVHVPENGTEEGGGVVAPLFTTGLLGGGGVSRGHHEVALNFSLRPSIDFLEFLVGSIDGRGSGAQGG